MAKRGRPPIADVERRTELISVRVTPAEHATLTRAAQAAGKTASDLLRTEGLSAAQRTKDEAP